jgi:hypothetical protein
MTGNRLTGGRGFVEHFRLDPDGRFNETQYQLVSRDDAYASSNPDQGPPDQGWGGWGWGAPSAQGAGGPMGGRSYYPSQDGQPQPRPLARGLFAPWSDPDDPRNRVRRDSDYFFGGRVN